jgi:type I restriction enzyme S subunit
MSWKTAVLGNITQVLGGTTPDSGNVDLWGGQHVWVTPTDLGKLNAMVIVDSARRISDKALHGRSLPLIPKNAVIMSSRAPIGHLAIAGCNLYTNQGCKSFVCGETLDSEFLFFTLRHRMREIQDLGSGSTFSEVSKSALEAFEISFPPISEQRQIAARLKAQLTEVETARQAVRAQVQEIADLRTAIYREAFRQIVPVSVPPFFEEAPQDWRWCKLTNIARLESGHTPSRLRPDWWGGEVSWVSLTEIRALDGQWVERTQLRTNETGIANSAARILPRGTVCYSRTASVGFVTIMAAPMATSQDFANWVCGDELEPEFLMHALICARKELRSLATGATHKTIYMPTLESFHVCIPPRAKQGCIAARLKSQLAEVDAIAQAAAAQLAEIERLPQGLLARAFPAHPQGISA